MYKERSTDNFHDSSVFENLEYIFTVYYSKTNEPLLYLTSDVLPPLLEIEIVIRIAHWSGLGLLIFPIKRRRVMLEGRRGQTRGRQIRRWGKQRERLSQVLRDTCWVFSIRNDGSFIGVSYSFADWALLIEKWIDYVVTIRFHSRSDHSWLPCPFFCCLECHVNRIPPSLPNSAHADFWLARWTGWVLLFLCSFLVNGCQTVVDVFLLLPRWAFEFSFPGEHLNFHMLMLQGNLRFYEMIRGGSPLDLSANFGVFLFGEAWAYKLKKIFARRTRVCGLIMPGQGEFYIMLFHWCSVQPTFHVSRRYRRADIRRTFTVSASLPMMRPTVDILSRWICACVLSFPYSDCGE